MYLFCALDVLDNCTMIMPDKLVNVRVLKLHLDVGCNVAIKFKSLMKHLLSCNICFIDAVNRSFIALCV